MDRKTEPNQTGSLGATGKTDRELTQDIFIRVCRDSGWRLDMYRAAALAAKVLGKHPMDIWIAMPDLQTLERIASGQHPVCERARP